MITKTKPSSSERNAATTSVCYCINRSIVSLKVCRICLRSDIKMIEDMDDTLAEFYDELVCYDTYDHPILNYCVLCEHQLKRFYNFRQKCRRAHILLKMWSSNRLQPKRVLKELYRLIPHPPIGVCTAESNQAVFDYILPELNTPVHDWPDLELHFDETDCQPQLTEGSPENSALKTEDDVTCTDLKSYVQDFLKLSTDVDIEKTEKAKQEESDKSTNEQTQQHTNSGSKNKGRVKKTKQDKNNIKPMTRAEVRIKNFKEKIVDLLENGEFQDIEDHGVRMTKEVFLKAMEQGPLERIGLRPVLRKRADMDKVRIFLRRLLRRFNPEYETMFRMESLDTPEKKQAEFEARPHTDEYKAAVYKCDICYRVFDVQGKLDFHMKWHDPIHPYACTICSMRYDNNQQRVSHMREMHLITYHCKLCPYRTYSTESMQSHYRNHKGVQYPCPTCHKVFNLKANREAHWREIHCVTNICQICGRGFCNKTKLQEHIQKHSDVPPETLAQPPSVRCDSCDAVLYSQKALDFHRLRSHQPIITEAQNRRYQCFYCKIYFDSIAALYEHKRSEDHRSNIPLVPTSHRTCLICREEVKIETNRTMYCHYTKMHPGVPYMSVGWGEQTVLCEQCGKACKGQFAYKEHVRVQHPLVRPHACAECGERFALRRQMAAHLKSHNLPPVNTSNRSNRSNRSNHSNRVKPARRFLAFQCDICLRAFNYKPNLLRHCMTHTGEKPYPCTLCGKRFTQKGNVKLHIDTVHLGKPAPPRRPRPRSLQAKAPADSHSPFTEDVVMLDDGYDVVEEITI